MENDNKKSFGGKKVKEEPIEDNDYYVDENPKEQSEWWNESMSRRNATKTLAVLGGSVVVGAVVLAAILEDDEEDDDVEVKQDANALQMKEGWNVGATDKQLVYPTEFLVESDSKDLQNWRDYFSPGKFRQVYEPLKQNMAPYFVPTLAQNLNSDSFSSQIKLMFTPEMARAYSQGLGFKEIISQNKNNDNLLLIVDMPGPESVAFSAAMADCADLILTFDNIPHPIGVVPSHLTLSSLLYYANEVNEKKQKRVQNAVSLFVMDRSRFIEIISEDTQFDNRYFAKLPSVDDLKKNKITNIMYCVNNEKQELDDLNDDFVAFQNNGINVNLIDLNQFKNSESDSSAVLPFGKTIGKDTLNSVRRSYSSAPPVYHYGGGIHFIPIFYGYNPYMTYGGRVFRGAPPANSYRPSTYKPVSRPTIFSSTSFGGKSGIGRVKPSGFGMVSTRVSGTSGKVTGVRAGRSGSFGRVGGRGG